MGAVAASLLSMASRPASEEGAGGREAYAHGRADEFDALRRSFLEHVEGEVELLAREERARAQGKKEQLGELRIEKIELPLSIQETAVAALRLATVGARDLRPSHADEFRLAIGLMGGTADGAHRLVAAQLATLAPGPLVEERRPTNELLGRQAAQLMSELERELATTSEETP